MDFLPRHPDRSVGGKYIGLEFGQMFSALRRRGHGPSRWGPRLVGRPTRTEEDVSTRRSGGRSSSHEGCPRCVARETPKCISFAKSAGAGERSSAKRRLCRRCGTSARTRTRCSPVRPPAQYRRSGPREGGGSRSDERGLTSRSTTSSARNVPGNLGASAIANGKGGLFTHHCVQRTGDES